jgi:hypothetical protein
MRKAEPSEVPAGGQAASRAAKRPRSEPQPSEAREAAGLTLLEVLGAVALLGILYTVLSGKAIEGLRSEGESRRRLEASLLADDRLSAIELALASGVVPELGSSEEEVDGGFAVATDVRALTLTLPEPEEREGSSLAARRAARRGQDAPSIFAPSRGGPAAPPLRSVEVVVRWTEGIYEREVRRATYALDTAAIEPLFASLAEFPGNRPGPGEGEDAEAGTAAGRERAAGRGRERAAGRGRERQRQTTQPLPAFEIPELDASGFESPDEP